MKRSPWNGTLLLVAVCMLPLSAAAYSQESSVIAGGGGYTESAGYTLIGTIGQPVAGLTTGTAYTNHSGFWNLRTGDTIPPIAPAFSLTSPFRSTSTPFYVPMTLSSTDVQTRVTGYYISESSTRPASAWGAGWFADPAPATLQVETPGSTTYYAWARDEAGNISPVSSATAEIIRQWLLSVSRGGSGGVSITVSPGEAVCTEISPVACSYAVDDLTVVAVTGNPDSKSQLAAWSGSIDSSDNPLSFSMTSDMTTTGTFGAVVSPARIVYDKGYSSLSAVIPALKANCTIEARDNYFATQAEELLFNRNYTVDLIGGMDANWDVTSGYTGIKGALKVSSGRLNVKGVKVKP